MSGDRIFWQYRDDWEGSPFSVGTAPRPDDPMLIGVAVPEPGTALLLAGGLALFGLRGARDRWGSPPLRAPIPPGFRD